MSLRKKINTLKRYLIQMHVINNSTLNLIINHNFQGKGKVARPFLTKGKEDNDDVEDHERM